MRGEGQVGVAGRIRVAHLDALGLRARRVHRDAAGRRAVAARVGQVDRRLEARHEPLVGVRRRVRERRERPRVLQDAADVAQAQLREAGVAVAREQRLAVLPDRLVAVHARAVVVEERLRHEGRRHAVAPRHVLHHVLVVAAACRPCCTSVSKRMSISPWPRGRHLVVLRLDARCRASASRAPSRCGGPGACPSAAPGSSPPCGAACRRGWLRPRRRPSSTAPRASRCGRSPRSRRC